MSMSESEINAATREVLKRSVTDPEFRVLAVRDGSAAIARVSGKTPPSGTSIKFLDNSSATSKVIVLPDPVSDADLISDEQLEAVAGGAAASCEASSCGTSHIVQE